MRLLAILLFFMMCPVFTALAQTDYKKRAAKYYKVQNYERALPDYQRALKKNDRDGEVLEKIIDCYFNSNFDRTEAMLYVDKLEKLKPQHPQLELFKAKASFHALRFADALDHLALYAQRADLKPLEQASIDVLEKQILNAQSYVMKPIKATFVNLGPGINTDRSEINPFVTANDSVMFFASDKKFNSASGINYYNICVAAKSDTAWMPSKTVGSKVNTLFDEITAGLGFGGGGDLLFVCHNRFNEETLASTRFQGGVRFTDLADMELSVNQKGADYGACLSLSGDTLYFANEGDDGRTDILFSIKLPNGKWGDARPLPGLVNTTYDENFPQLSGDGKTLWFASNGELSMGGYDIFQSQWVDSLSQWGAPTNLGYPINDTYDNFTFSRPTNANYGYVSAVRPNGLGLRDIYKVVLGDATGLDVLFKFQLLGVDADSDYQALLYDASQSNLVGKYKCSPRSGTFLVSVPPGSYWLRIENENGLAVEQKFDVPILLVGNGLQNRQIRIGKP